MADSIRKQIIDAVVDKFTSIVAGVDDYIYAWDKVSKGPMPQNYQLQQNTNEIYVYTGVERSINESIQYITKELPVNVEFWHYNLENEIVSDVLEDMLGDVIRAMKANIYWEGLALNTTEVENDLDYESNEKQSNGVLVVDITYRHVTDDPTSSG